MGLSAYNLRAGDVLRMTPLQFSQMRERPAGLVYEVNCRRVENDPRPIWVRALTLMGNETAPTVRDLVRITDCAIEMGDSTRVEGALIFLTGPGEARIISAEGASLGDPMGSCDPARRMRLMATGDLAMPADLARPNVSAVAGGDILLEERPDFRPAAHAGLVLRAGKPKFRAMPGRGDLRSPGARDAGDRPCDARPDRHASGNAAIAPQGRSAGHRRQADAGRARRAGQAGQRDRTGQLTRLARSANLRPSPDSAPISTARTPQAPSTLLSLSWSVGKDEVPRC